MFSPIASRPIPIGRTFTSAGTVTSSAIILQLPFEPPCLETSTHIGTFKSFMTYKYNTHMWGGRGEAEGFDLLVVVIFSEKYGILYYRTWQVLSAQQFGLQMYIWEAH